jgi:hypothetical protein
MQRISSSRIIAGCICAAAAFGAHAQQASAITAPGGFVTACASSNNGAGFWPGANLANLYGASNCYSDYINVATHPTATAPAANGTSTAQGEVSMGAIHMKASNNSVNYGFNAGGVNGGWTQRMHATGGTAGTAGYFQYDVQVDGALFAQGFAGAASVGVAAYKNGALVTQYLPANAPKIIHGANEHPVSTSMQYSEWAVSSSGYFGPSDPYWSASQSFADTVTFVLPVIYGQDFDLGIYAYALAGMRSASGVAGMSTSTVDFWNTIRWGGLHAAYDAQGNLLQGVRLIASDGTDWTGPYAAPVPEPETYAMMMAGIGLLGWARRRKTDRKA